MTYKERLEKDSSDSETHSLIGKVPDEAEEGYVNKMYSNDQKEDLQFEKEKFQTKTN